MLITVKNNGKGSQGIYANGSKEAVFILPGRARRVTVTDAELVRIRRVNTLAVVTHTDDSVTDSFENDDSDTLTGDPDVVVEPVLDEPQPVDKPWEAAAGKRGKK